MLQCSRRSTEKQRFGLTTIRSTRFPVNFSATPAEVRRHAPRLGEHSIEILREAGLGQEAIDALVESGATHQAD